ncbi:MAG: DUF1922 domain-containing protein [Candidatus Helarchaeota archaeon]
MHEKKFVLFLCGNCGTKLYSPRTQKTKKCIRCGKIIKIETAKKIGSFKSEPEAILALKYSKVPKDIQDEFLKEMIDKSQIKKTKESNLKLFQKLIVKLSNECKDGLIPIELINKEAKNIGFTEELIKRYLRNFLIEGLIYEPKAGHVHLI